MLWYKAWLETRSRFLICLVGCTLVCSAFVLYTQGQGLPDTKSWFYSMTLFYAHQYLVGMWVLSAVLLGMGGLVREAASGTASFTLALPVSRRRVAVVRIAMGILQMLLLAIVPWIAICIATLAAGHPLVWTQVFRYVLVLTGGGLVYFALSILVSSIVEKEYTAPTLAFGIVIATSLLPGIVSQWRRFSVLRLISGSDALDKTTYLLQQPIPWRAVLASLFVCAILLQASVLLTERREF